MPSASPIRTSSPSRHPSASGDSGDGANCSDKCGRVVLFFADFEARSMKTSRAEFESYVDQALAEIPASFAPYLQDVVIDIEPMPDRAACESVGLSNPRNLLGLYRGVPLTGRHVEAPLQLPDRITLYQDNIERICNSRDELVRQIRKTVLHEIGHHFGLDEDDLTALGYG